MMKICSVNQHSCAFTGHRPKSFPWKYDETASDCILLKEVLAAQIAMLANGGITDWFSGMAQGTDHWSAEIVLGLRERSPGMRLHCILPCEGQEKGWAASWQKNGWRKADKKPALNADLWERLLELSRVHTIRLHWVKGHAENEWNNRCDELAVAESKKFKE